MEMKRASSTVFLSRTNVKKKVYKKKKIEPFKRVRLNTIF